MSANSSHFSYHRRAQNGRALALALVAALALAALPHVGNAQSPKKTSVAPSLEGSWSGGGTVTFASGARERRKLSGTLQSRGPEQLHGQCYLCHTPGTIANGHRRASGRRKKRLL